MFEFIRRMRDFGLEAAIDRYYSKYPGKVSKTDDPQQQGRIKVTCEPLGRTDELLNWAYPVSPFAGDNYGFYFPPEVGDTAWVWFENGETQSPNYVGSWFCNPDDAKKPATSCVPAEFRNDSAASPTRRGIKTKAGHGLMFEDNPDNPKVELWSGSQESAGKPAKKNRWLRMQDKPDGEKTIVIASVSGHSTEWSDKTGDVYVRTQTAGEHVFDLNDTDHYALLKTKDGHYLRLDDQVLSIELKSKDGHTIRLQDNTKKIEVISKSGHQIVLDDNTQKILLRSKGLREITLDDLLQRITVQNKVGQSIFMDAVGTTITEPALVTINAAGAIALNGKGIATSSTGGGPMTTSASGVSTNVFTGAVTENYNGALSMIINGVLTVTNAVLSIAGSNVGLGPGTRFRLVDERFFATFMLHTHNTTIAGAPTGPPITGIPSPGSDTTINTRAS